MELRKEIQKILNNNTINKNRVDLLVDLFEKRREEEDSNKIALYVYALFIICVISLAIIHAI